jgi:signal peptidase II
VVAVLKMWRAPGSSVILPDNKSKNWLESMRLLYWLALSVVIILSDQWTKGLAEAQLNYGQPVPVLSILNMNLQYNTGAAFSFLSDQSGWQRWFFSAVAIVVCSVLLVWLSRLQRGQWMLALSLALILGGALGNLVDRLTLGYVVDFISVHYGNAYFPAFNIADSAISVGAFFMILDTFLNRHEDVAEEAR